jgi:hypothetical protein
LFAFALGLPARTCLLAALALLAEIALLALALARRPFLAFPAALSLYSFSAFALSLGLAGCAALLAALAYLAAALPLRSLLALLLLGLARAALAAARALPLLRRRKHGPRSDGGGRGRNQQFVPHQAILLDFAARARRVLGTVQRKLLSVP